MIAVPWYADDIAMWTLRALFLILFLYCVNAFTQTAPAPTPTPGGRQTNSIVSDKDRYDQLHMAEMMTTPRVQPRTHPLLDSKTGIYRKPSKSEIEILAVSGSLLQQYSDLLAQPNTGIVKLNAESSCMSDAAQIVASEKCAPYRIPGAGTAYSFRTVSYRLPRLADIILLDGNFRTGGIYEQVVIANVGDIPLKDISLESSGMKYLLDLQPVNDVAAFTRYDKELQKGILSNGFLYRTWQPVKENSTFILRSIAYRGEFRRSIDGISYNELDFDKRRDVIVAFRVVDKDPAGNLTILWRALKEREAPKLKNTK